MSNSPYLSQLNPWPFWHPPTACYTKPSGMTLLSKPWSCRCREGHMAQFRCYSKCFRHKLVNLFHVFLHHWDPPVCLACHHSISCSLQTIRRCWTYFKSVCLDWQGRVGETGLKLSKAMPGQAFSSKIMLSVSDWLCFRWVYLDTGIKTLLDTTLNDITSFSQDQRFWLKLGV